MNAFECMECCTISKYFVKSNRWSSFTSLFSYHFPLILVFFFVNSFLWIEVCGILGNSCFSSKFKYKRCGNFESLLLRIFWQKFRETNVLTKEVTTELISRKKISRFSTLYSSDFGFFFAWNHWWKLHVHQFHEIFFKIMRLKKVDNLFFFFSFYIFSHPFVRANQNYVCMVCILIRDISKKWSEIFTVFLIFIKLSPCLSRETSSNKLSLYTPRIIVNLCKALYNCRKLNLVWDDLSLKKGLRTTTTEV